MKPSRRALLRGAGVALMLPFLPSLLPRSSWSAPVVTPTRLLVFYVPNGIQMDWFTPDRLGAGYDLKDITRPLEAVQEHVSVITGLANVQAEDTVAGDHARGTGSFLTCVPIRHTAGNDIENGISVDQVIAQARGHETLFPSLQVGIQPGGNTGDCTAGYSCAYTRNVSWAGPQTPLPNVTDPQVLFDRLAGVDVALDPATRALRSSTRSRARPPRCSPGSASRTGSSSTSTSPPCARSRSAWARWAAAPATRASARRPTSRTETTSRR